MAPHHGGRGTGPSIHQVGREGNRPRWLLAQLVPTEKAQEAVKNFKPYVDKSMKDQPMATLGIAAVIGFVLGALWKK
jgi:hypothetical protein